MFIAQFLSYTLTRVVCTNCGKFEHGSQGTCIAVCPHCGSILLLEMSCRGMTSQALPFTTAPRLSEEEKLVRKDDAKKGFGPGVGEYKPKRAGHRANGKSTGRPRGGLGRGQTKYRPGRGSAYADYKYEGKFQPKGEDGEE